LDHATLDFDLHLSSKTGTLSPISSIFNLEVNSTGIFKMPTPIAPPAAAAQAQEGGMSVNPPLPFYLKKITDGWECSL
jgi:hypothetical protein